MSKIKNSPTVKIKNVQNIVLSVKSAVQAYSQTFVGKTFLYVFEGKYIEVVFRTKDFLHLTGIQTILSSKEFYKESIRGTLTAKQIKTFTPQHPYNLCVKKLSQLQNLAQLTNSPIFILEDLATQTFTYKFGLTELTFTVCLSHDTSYNGTIQSSCFVPRSLRVEDSVDRSSSAYEVNYIFSKSNNEKLYSEVCYRDNISNIDELAQEIKEMINPSLLVQ